MKGKTVELSWNIEKEGGGEGSGGKIRGSIWRGSIYTYTKPSRRRKVRD